MKGNYHEGRSELPVEEEERFSPSDLGIEIKGLPSQATRLSVAEDPPADYQEPILVEIADDHPLWVSTEHAVADGYAGVILSGPPGTGKSWYAEQLALRMTGSRGRVRTVQFHPGYQYEDFVEGWRPDDSGGFVRRSKHLLVLARAARMAPDAQHVLVIDEISRADVPRVFGEALTYLEMSMRGKIFHLASGRAVSLPPNLFIIATMNPWDVSVDELDVALERRFAHLEVGPSLTELESILRLNNASERVIDRSKRLFNLLQRSNNHMLHMGHAYFARVVSEESLDRLWQFQVWPHIKRVTRLDPSEGQRLETAWLALSRPTPPENEELASGLRSSDNAAP
ncbi:AAA family ATPase [Luteimonas sp. RC10]|uniref:McrB family protein n=1 Tax=Luteimonas sp. RC10 TaxID=2587035 RepID=UPI0016156EF8|nr:AAA family ATPase [Luteimonas sp. RC10]MBB3344376.1 5-methylcytosine-specific restriction protein B [Luteimonas sp. RC10]